QGMTKLIDWITVHFSSLFDALENVGTKVMEFMTSSLLLIPPLIFILLVVILAYFVSDKRYGLPFFAGIGLLYIQNQNLWGNMMNTLTLIIVASILSIIIGVPLGILMAKSSTAQKIIQPILDFMQTMPAFVYLIPAVVFFGIGMVPGIFASVIFATPPVVRFTNLGIRQVSVELVEAADAFGTTSLQKLFKVELPMASKTMMAGVNQTVMLSLSMVVIASMIGAPGLGNNVLTALERSQEGAGFVAGLSIVILAIIIDRITQKIAKDK